MKSRAYFDSLRRSNPHVVHWIALPTARTSHGVRFAYGLPLVGARLASRRFYEPNSGYARLGGSVAVCISTEPLVRGLHDNPSLMRLLERSSQTRTDLLVLAPDCSDEVLATLAVNRSKGVVISLPVVAEVARLSAIAQTLGVPVSTPDALTATSSLPIQEVLATAGEVVVTSAQQGPSTVPIGVISLGGRTDAEAWESWREVTEAIRAPAH